MRLNKYLAEAGAASRRKADELITAGQVKVNGQVVTEMGSKVDPEKDIVSLDGTTLSLVTTTTTYLLNKPKGVVTTAHDPEGKPTVLDYVPNEPRVFPCGRLDEDTMGLVLLTNDGDLCYKLTHPKFEHQKQYVVHGSSKNPEAGFKKLSGKIVLKDGPVAVDKLELHKIQGNKIDFTITIHEGRNRIVRRLCSAVGIEVINLTRTKLGKYELGDLEPGKYKQV